MSDFEILDIVNEKDEVIGQGTRKEIHEKKLLHRTVCIWYYNKNGEVVFQKRSKVKNGSHVSLGFSVGGHVKSGQDIVEAAIQEAKEETGLDIEKENLEYISTTRIQLNNEKLGIFQNHIEYVYAYYYSGDIKDLKIEEGEGEGFEWWRIEDVFAVPVEEREKFGRSIFMDEVLQTLQKVLDLSKK